jgi:hypothetical protein
MSAFFSYGLQGRGYLGPALNWKRLSYADRKDRMIESLVSGLAPKATAENVFGFDLDGKAILCRPAAVPDALAVAAVRELVGQPHLSDHTYAITLKKF